MFIIPNGVPSGSEACRVKVFEPSSSSFAILPLSAVGGVLTRIAASRPFFAVFNPHESHESGMWPGMVEEITFDPAAVVVPPTFPDTPKVREALAQMYTQIEIVDRYFGELLDQLEEDGLADNTIVVHWSDHGPLPRGKRWPYDSGSHIPMIVRWPGHMQEGLVSDQLVSTIDLGPSMLSACGIASNAGPAGGPPHVGTTYCPPP